MAPYSISFNCDGTNLYAGLRNMVKVFDSTRPGRECTTLTTFSKYLAIKSICIESILSSEKSYGGQRGMISCIAPHPLSADTYALGSYSCSGNQPYDSHCLIDCVFSCPVLGPGPRSNLRILRPSEWCNTSRVLSVWEFSFLRRAQG